MTTPAADGHEPPTMRTAARIAPRIRRFTPASIAGLSVMAALVVLLAVMPYLVPIATSRQLTNLFVYVIIATAWNLLAGFGGMVSIGQQAYIGIGAYGVVVFADNLGLDPLLSIPIVAVVAAIVAIPVSYLAFRLVGGYFAVGTWVVAEVVRLTTIHFPQVGAGSGVSLRAMTQAVPDPDLRTAVGYWAGLVCAVVVVAAVVLLARSRIGLALTAVRDEPTAAATSGVNVVSAKRIVFIVAAAAAGLAGALIAISTLRVQPGGPLGVFSVQWTAFMIFIVVIGGVGSIEGPIIGAVLFWVLEILLRDYGAFYLIGLGVLAVVMVLVAPGGIWGLITRRRRVDLFPIGYRLDRRSSAALAPGRVDA